MAAQRGKSASAYIMAAAQKKKNNSLVIKPYTYIHPSACFSRWWKKQTPAFEKATWSACAGLFVRPCRKKQLQHLTEFWFSSVLFGSERGVRGPLVGVSVGCIEVLTILHGVVQARTTSCAEYWWNYLHAPPDVEGNLIWFTSRMSLAASLLLQVCLSGVLMAGIHREETATDLPPCLHA